MEGASNLERENKSVRRKGEKLGSVLEPKIEPFVPRKGYDPRELKSWAKRTGFVSTFSGETERSLSGRREFNEGRNNGNDSRFNLEKGIVEKNESTSPKFEIDPILGRTRKRGPEIEPAWGGGNGRDKNGILGFRDGAVRGETEMSRNGVVPEVILDTKNTSTVDGISGNENGVTNGNGHGNGATMVQKTDDGDLGGGGGVGRNIYPDGEDSGDGGWHPSPRMIYGVKDNPGYG